MPSWVTVACKFGWGCRRRFEFAEDRRRAPRHLGPVAASHALLRVRGRCRRLCASARQSPPKAYSRNLGRGVFSEVGMRDSGYAAPGRPGPARFCSVALRVGRHMPRRCIETCPEARAEGSPRLASARCRNLARPFARALVRPSVPTLWRVGLPASLLAPPRRSAAFVAPRRTAAHPQRQWRAPGVHGARVSEEGSLRTHEIQTAPR